MTPDKKPLPIIESQVFLLPVSAEKKHLDTNRAFTIWSSSGRFRKETGS